ncbi:MAG: flagellar biosynthesis protein FlhB [Firmicutes bacterium]|nr:flagellar biosynthesis protein FlhB [Bacillota bacterium]
MSLEFRLDLQLFADGKTEPATPRRREEARKKGRVAKSQELNTALVLLGISGLLTVSGEWALRQMVAFMQQVIGGGLAGVDFSLGGLQALQGQAVLCILMVAGPVMGFALVLGLMGQLLQVGFNITAEPLKPQLSRMNPVEGAKRIFSKRALMELGKACLKIGIVTYVAYVALRNDIGKLPSLLWMEPVQAIAYASKLVGKMGLWIGACLLIVAAIDYLYQRWEYEDSIKMSIQDIKDELKQTEGDPQIRSVIRARQRQLARSRMMQAVPTADVVITNPTHVAVALKYDAKSMAAPIVVAKGAELLAARIREIASENDIPIVENPPLARTLYEATQVGREIPADLYQAVAEVLAYVYRL